MSSCERCKEWQRQGLSCTCPSCDMFSEENITHYKTTQERLAEAMKDRDEWAQLATERMLQRDQYKAALQEIADYPLSDYGGVIARKALGIPE